jgi:hypothetical protein
MLVAGRLQWQPAATITMPTFVHIVLLNSFQYGATVSAAAGI